MADFSKLKRRTLGLPPSPDEASENLQQPELVPATTKPGLATAVAIAPAPTPMAEPAADSLGYQRRDGRSLRRTNRTIQFATRVTPDFDRRIRDLAEREGLLIVEVLERALDAYESKQLSG